MKRFIMMAVAVMMMTLTANAQTAKEQKDKVYDVCEVLPEYPGGTIALMKFLGENVVYPPEAAKRKEQGRVLVGFVVEKDGSVTDVQVLRGVDPSLDKEAIRVITAMPKWKPGKQRGKPVRVKYTVPVTFRLQ